MARLYLLAGKKTDSVTHGFLPAALGLGLDPVVLTDRPDDHIAAYEHDFGDRVAVLACDVSDFRAVIAAISRQPARAEFAIFSNSDHLQPQTALAAEYFGLPGKDWRAALHTKNKALMRRRLAETGLDEVFSAEPPVPADAPFPLVLKPREGVASEDVHLVRDPAELAARQREIAGRRDDPLIVEEYLPGPLHTLETLGDGRDLHVIASLRTTLSPPPRFVELRLDSAPPPAETGQVLDQLRALGVGLGACHTEFAVHEGRARLIEVNYRVIGDHGDFMLAELLGVPLFELILRLHLGEPLPRPAPRYRGHATADCVLPRRAGVLVDAPGPADEWDGDVHVVYRPLRTAGDTVPLTGTNRDYLGIIRAVGPSATAVDDALRKFRDRHDWRVR